MPNGKPGDHPLTDITVHGLRVYSRKADGLVREIVHLGGREEIAEMLVLEYNNYQHPEIKRLERVLREIRDRLDQDRKQRGP